jgi:hypothetical protein
MDDKDKIISSLEKKNESKQIFIFMILWIAGIFVLAEILNKDIGSLKFIIGSWLVVFAAWKISKSV